MTGGLISILFRLFDGWFLYLLDLVYEKLGYYGAVDRFRSMLIEIFGYSSSGSSNDSSLFRILLFYVRKDVYMVEY
jgi:hypothetical protein